MTWGRVTEARRLLLRSIYLHELPDAHYMLGLLYEGDYNPGLALKHFKRCLELDCTCELSVAALRECTAMRGYKKKFRGSWLLLAILSFLAVSGVATLRVSAGVGLVSTLLWGFLAVLYWGRKYK